MNYEKIAPGLMSAMEDYRSEGRAGLNRHMRMMGLVSTETSPKPPRAVVFLHCDDDARLEYPDEYGIRVNQQQGRVRTAFLPLDSLDYLSNDAAVKRIIPARTVRPTMDVARDSVHVSDFSRSTELTGDGAIIGIVDSGIDPKHPAFAGRILRIWDQDLHGPGVAEGNYGLELTEDMIQVSRDTHGHGTHVAGIAAGKHDIYSGVAPDANLVIVKTGERILDAHIADGIRYIFRVAAEMNSPAVINLSLGGHGDAHDGTDSLSQVIDAESGPGRVVCCAAGNEGNDNIHAQITLTEDRHDVIRVLVPYSSGPDSISTVWLNGWYSGSDRIEVAVRTPAGFQTPYQPVQNGPGKTHAFPDGTVHIETPGPDPANGDHNFLVTIRNPAASVLPVTDGKWLLLLRGESIAKGTVDVWVIDNSMHDQVQFSSKWNIMDAMKIGSPGAARSAITVASYTTKVQWTDTRDRSFEVGFILNDISPFSSEGPLRNGEQKPDTAAPGAMIASAMSADSDFDPGYIVSEGYRIDAGTSMATPFITGIVALLLQRDPQLNPDSIKAWLHAHSAIPNKPRDSFDPRWGYGVISMPVPVKEEAMKKEILQL